MKKVLTAAVLLTLAAAANAADVSDNPSGGYVGLGWGQFNLRLDRLDDVGAAVNSVTDSDDNAWKAFAGYRVNPYLAFEGAYIDFGRPGDRFDTSGTDGNYRADISGFAPYVIGTVPLGPVELFGKLGYLFYDVDINVDLDGPGPGVDSSHSDSALTYGAGVGFTILDHLHLRAEYEIVDIDDASDSSAFWLTGAWRF